MAKPTKKIRQKNVNPAEVARRLDIPVDESGNIPIDKAIARLHSVKEGSRSGKHRNAFVDLGVTAQRVAPLNPRSNLERHKQYAWWAYPNESDMEGIDTKNAGTWAKAHGKNQKTGSIAIIDASPRERAAILQIINRNFTDRERRRMNGLVINVQDHLIVADELVEANALYQHAVFGHDEGKPAEFDTIYIRRDKLIHQPDKAGPRKGDPVYDATLTHELIHFLRYRDDARQGYVLGKTTQASRRNLDQDSEEVFTDAETVARMRIAPDRREGGYYSDIPWVSSREEEERSIVHDKQLLMNVRKGDGPKIDPKAMRDEVRNERRGEAPTDSTKLREAGFKDRAQRDRLVVKMFQGRKGLKALGTANANFPRLHIAHANITGKAELIDTYWQLLKKNKKGLPDAIIFTHIRSSSDVDPKELRRLAAPINGELTEFRDGRPVKVPLPRRPHPLKGLAGAGITQKMLDRGGR